MLETKDLYQAGAVRRAYVGACRKWGRAAGGIVGVKVGSCFVVGLRRPTLGVTFGSEIWVAVTFARNEKFIPGRCRSNRTGRGLLGTGAAGRGGRPGKSWHGWSGPC